LADKRAVFVPFGLPGEEVRVQIGEEKKGFARGAISEILKTAPDRTGPRCPHFTACGGCAYQHIAYETQLQAKTEILRDQLQRIGKLEVPAIQPIVAAPTPWNYRSQIRFYFTTAGELGFQAPRSPEVVPITECHLMDKTLTEIWPRLDMGTIPGLDQISLRVGAGEEVLLILESSDPHPLELEVDLPISVIHAGPGGSLVLAGDDHLISAVAGREFQVSADSFFPANLPMAETMIQHILDHLEIPKNATLIDAYCGVGLRSAFLAPRVNRLISIEATPSACEDFVVNLDEFDNVELYEAAVERVLPALGLSPDILVAAPPKSGLGPRTLDGVFALGPETIVYVSRDPATLSRDARRLTEGGYQLQKITPFDSHPQTYQIGSISFWRK